MCCWGKPFSTRRSQSGSSVPALDTVGTGDATLFHGGGAVTATWRRAGADEPFALTANDGTELVLPVGRLWIAVFPTTSTLSWE